MPVPLAAHIRLLGLDPPRAGALGEAEVELENLGSATWRTTGPVTGVHAAYHWLDGRGNPIVWDGLRTGLGDPIPPGERRVVRLRVRAPIPPGPYRLALDLVEEGRTWFADVGGDALVVEAEVAPRIARRLAARGGAPDALAAQDEPLVPEEEAEAVALLGEACAPAPDWSRRVLDAHQEGYALVGGSVAWEGGLLGRRPRALEPYVPGQGRVPGFAHPLVCFSHVRGLTPDTADAVEGLPAARAPDGEPALFDGRIVVRARPRSGRRRG